MAPKSEHLLLSSTVQRTCRTGRQLESKTLIVLLGWGRRPRRLQPMSAVDRRPSGKPDARPAPPPLKRELTDHHRDQELRFTVHDGPDYYQLKISVFTDDKRTDLVGESWIDLKNIIVPGGGQGDVWQTLSCRGKYAGEIRLEITYYDIRPKPDKPVAKARPQPAAPEHDTGSVRQRPAGPKRRPLPSDPVTGEVPAAAPLPVPPTAASKIPAAQEKYQTPPRVQPKPPSHPGYVPNQSPLQSMEYQTPPSSSRYASQDQYSQSPIGQHQTPPRHYDAPSRLQDDFDYSPRGGVAPYQHSPEARGPPFPEHYDHIPLREDPANLPQVDDDRPPPPPAHRSSYGGGPDPAHARLLDGSPPKSANPMPMRHDVLKSEAHRHSVSAYPGSRPAFRAYDSAPPAANHQPPPMAPPYEQAPPRHHSYDQSYDSHHRSMQATVEDAPESPQGQQGQAYRHSTSRGRQSEDMGYGHGASPAPLNLSRSPGASPLHQSPSPRELPAYDDQAGYSGSASMGSGREMVPVHPQSHYQQTPNNFTQRSPYGQEYQAPRRQSSSQALPDLPPSLVPGMDPHLSQELSERVYDERRQDNRRHTAHYAELAPRGRHMSEPPTSYTQADIGSYGHGHAPQPLYERRSGSDVTYTGGPDQRASYSNNVSPGISPGASPGPPGDAQHRIKRKSVSPAPPPAEARKSSEIPFGPDSFDAFNTSMTASDRAVVDPDAKIVTHDGREIDPSDHLPVESWAPEPEAKDQKQPSPEPRSRPSPAGAQPMPPSGRRQLRIAGRPQQPPAASHPAYGPHDPHTPPGPSSAGRNRLHKKGRPSAGGPSPSGSPLAPISPDNYQDNRGSPYTPTRSGGPRQSAHHYDYPNENNAPPHYGSAPPVPAKVPIAAMSGGNGGHMDEAFMQEMQRIDIGAGRSRRRGGY